MECDLLSISPKLANSTPSAAQAGKWQLRHERSRFAPEVIRRLIGEHEYQFKFVIDQPADCGEVEAYLHQFPQIDRNRVMLMPQGTNQEQLQATGVWLEPYCREHGLRFCPRKQIEWYGLVGGART